MRVQGTNVPAKIRTEIGSALALLVLGVGADDHDAAVATNHPALVAHALH